MSDVSCPECGSSQVQRQSVIYESGTSTGRSTSVALVGDRMVPIIGMNHRA